MEIIYIVASIPLAVIFFRGLGRYDGPTIPDRMLNDIAFGDRSFVEREAMMNTFRIRRMLSGSWFRAGWMFSLWLSIPFFFGDTPDLAGLLFALPGGWALAVAAYNVRKRMRGW